VAKDGRLWTSRPRMIAFLVVMGFRILAGLPKFILVRGGILRIGKFTFGSITIDGREFKQDVFITNNMVEEKESSHTITKDDIDKALIQEPDYIIVGRGTCSRVEIPDEIRDMVDRNRVGLIEGRTVNVIKDFNRLKGKNKVVGIFHITC
jgi:hypothetical protein